MDYKLALALKNAGFPQRNHIPFIYPENTKWIEGFPSHIDGEDKFGDSFYKRVKKELDIDADINLIVSSDDIEKYEALRVCNPTLSELISACGDGFISLSRIDFIDSEKLQTDKKVVKYHRFNASGGKVRELTYRNKTYEHVKLGKTPEEAVARLWLALNKK